MRADRTTQDDRLFSAKGAARWLRVDVKDAGGTFRDLSAQRGYNFIEKATYKLDHDTAIATATVTLRREIFKLSLAPDIAGSALNTLGGGTQLLLPNTRIRLYTQLQPAGVAPDASKWSLVFDGVIDKPDSGRDPITLECSDLAKQLDTRFIENQRAYGVWQPGQRYIGDATVGAVVVPGASDPTFPQKNLPDGAPTGPWLRCTVTGTASANNWVASTSTANGTVRTPTVPNGFTYVSSGGTLNTGTTEPTWPTTTDPTGGKNQVTEPSGLTWTCTQPAPPVWPNVVGNTVTDNGITWKCVVVAGGTPTGTPLETQIQMVLDDNMGVGAWTLYTPSASGEVCRPYTQSCEPVLQACQKLADILGWDVRYKWKPSATAFALTFYDPVRTNTTSGYTIGPSAYAPIDSVTRDLNLVRNKIKVTYPDTGGGNDSNPIIASVTVQDATSQATYGVLFAGVSVGAGSQINSATAATSMANAILSDLAMAPLTIAVAFDFAWWFELADVITVSKDGEHFDSDQKGAIWSLEHTLEQGSGWSSTKIGLRAKPSTGFKRWHDGLELTGQNGGPSRTLAPVAAQVPALSATIAGLAAKWTIPNDRHYDHTEVHISTTTGFAPSTSTLAGTTRSGRWDFAPKATGSSGTGALVAGTAYYVRLLHKVRHPLGIGFLASPPGPQASVVADYVQTADIADGAIGVAELGNSLKQIARIEMTTNVVYGSGADLAFLSSGAESRYNANGVTVDTSNGTVTVGVNGFVRIHAGATIRDPGAGAPTNRYLMTQGYRAQLMIVVTRAGTPTTYLWGKWTPAIDSHDGTAEICCEVSGTLNVVASEVISFAINGVSPGNAVVALGASNRVLLCGKNVTSNNNPGTWLEVCPVP